MYYISENPFITRPWKEPRGSTHQALPIEGFQDCHIPISVCQAIVFVVENYAFWGPTCAQARSRLALALRRRFPNEPWARSITGDIVQKYYVGLHAKDCYRVAGEDAVEEWKWRYELSFRDLDAAVKAGKLAEASDWWHDYSRPEQSKRPG